MTDPENFEYVEGDLITMANAGEFDVIFHGANCMHTMGSGVAKAIRVNWNGNAARADQNETIKGDPSKMGQLTKAVCQNHSGQSFVVANLYTQYGYNPDPEFLNFSITALQRALTDLLTQFPDPTLRFGFPKIGAGLGGGDWEEISKVINDCFAPENRHPLLALDTDSWMNGVAYHAKFKMPKCVVLPGDSA